MNRKSYDIKSFCEVTINDYWNLREYPLYFHLNKKKKPYVTIRELPSEGYVRIDSLQKLSNHLSKFDWTYQPKYWSEISHFIRNVLNLPYTEL